MRRASIGNPLIKCAGLQEECQVNTYKADYNDKPTSESNCIVGSSGLGWIIGGSIVCACPFVCAAEDRTGNEILFGRSSGDCEWTSKGEWSGGVACD